LQEQLKHLEFEREMVERVRNTRLLEVAQQTASRKQTILNFLALRSVAPQPQQQQSSSNSSSSSSSSSSVSSSSNSSSSNSSGRSTTSGSGSGSSSSSSSKSERKHAQQRSSDGSSSSSGGRRGAAVSFSRQPPVQTYSLHSLDMQAWSEILEPEFVLILPITPYRSFPPFEVQDGRRHVRGQAAVISDCASLQVHISSLGVPCNDGKQVFARYLLLGDEVTVSGDVLMCKYGMMTENAMHRGSRFELSKSGMIFATFSPASNKLVRLEMVYDVMAFMQQLRRASSHVDFRVVPNNFQVAVEPSSEARVVTTVEGTISHASRNWCDLFGYTQEEVVGRNCKILQGPNTEHEILADLMARVRASLPAAAYVTNYTSSGEEVTNWLQIFPLFTDGAISHYLGICELVSPVTAAAIAAAAATTSASHAASSSSSSSSSSSQRKDPFPAVSAYNSTSTTSEGSLSSRSSSQTRPHLSSSSQHSVTDSGGEGAVTTGTVGRGGRGGGQQHHASSKHYKVSSSRGGDTDRSKTSHSEQSSDEGAGSVDDMENVSA